MNKEQQKALDKMFEKGQANVVAGLRHALAEMHNSKYTHEQIVKELWNYAGGDTTCCDAVANNLPLLRTVPVRSGL